MIFEKYHYFILSLLLLLSLFLFTFQLLANPPGLETDEGSISYNSILISRTLRDQNQRLLPFFILSSDHLDWKQPVLIYSSAIIFKLFGANLLNFKLVNVIYSLSTATLIYILSRLLIKQRIYALFSLFLYSITPMVIITTRIGNESILPAFFCSLWLVFLTIYHRHQNKRVLILGALSLGIGFSCFKGMRIIVPVWSTLTIFFIFLKNKFSKTSIIHFLYFFCFILPFVLIIPVLESKYPGSIFDRSSIPLENYRYYLHYWLANMNLFSLFSEPDIGKIYEMKYFGALLISTLPPFLAGIISLIKTKDYRFFLLVVFLLTPALFGIAKSTSYGHRLTGIIPLYVIITTFGLQSFFSYLKTYLLTRLLLLASILFFIVNTFDFLHYYYLTYPQQNSTKLAFSNNLHHSFRELSLISSPKKLEPYIQSDLYTGHGDANKFFELAYFPVPLKIWHLGDTMPQNSILLTQLSLLDRSSLVKTISSSPDINLLISK